MFPVNLPSFPQLRSIGAGNEFILPGLQRASDTALEAALHLAHLMGQRCLRRSPPTGGPLRGVPVWKEHAASSQFTEALSGGGHRKVTLHVHLQGVGT